MGLEMVRSVVVERAGEGDPLLLIHGTGGTRAHWDPVRDRLAARRSLLLVDLPGHGESPSPRGAPSTPIGYAAILAAVLDELGHQKVDVAGNSVGGWTALELAKLGRARSVVAISPAGLWPDRNMRSAKMKLRGQYRMGRRFARLTPHLMRSPVGRSLLLRGAMARPRQVPADAAVAMAAEYAATPDFETHLEATSAARFRDGAAIDCPVTIAWGEKERLIPKKARRLDELPPQTRVVALPGCGHVPMWDDP
ncbi:MAG TPA: alpha/beta fold hydrolase, partial [Solirubrobacterales bacterium]|nr:alpha/beta fold hydrolase [Solirubrobacterales bacterium]